MSNGRRVVSSAFQRWATRLDRLEVDPDVARCHAKRHHVEHAGFGNTGRAVAASRLGERTAPRAAVLDGGGVVRLGSKSHRVGLLSVPHRLRRVQPWAYNSAAC